jgi:hypothetical protein
VSFEGLNSSFRSITAMDLGWYKLEIIAFAADQTFQGCQGFVIQLL